MRIVSAHATEPTGFAAPYPSRKTLHLEMLKFAKPDDRQGLGLFASDYALYLAALAGVLFLDPLWAKILCSLIAGLKISNLASLGHDAAHACLVRDKTVNKWLAIFSFMPGLINYRLWVYDHHVLHHPKVNAKHENAFSPFSKAEFDALPRWRRMLERVYRAPGGLGLGLDFMVRRWLGLKFMPRACLPARVRAEGWPHFIFLVAYLGLFLAGLALAPAYSDTGSAEALLLGFAAPFYVWQFLMGTTLYLQHTDPRVPWFDGKVDRATVAVQEKLSTHLELPRWLKFLTHNVYDHAAHHVQPRIPCYRLADAQARLNELMGPYALKVDLTPHWLFDTVRRCKLYDYENHQWLDFSGRPTSERLVVADEDDAYGGEIGAGEIGHVQMGALSA